MQMIGGSRHTEAVRQVIDSDLLRGIISMPESFQNKQVEIIIITKEKKGTLPTFTNQDIDSMLFGSVTESLIGAIPQSNKTLEDYRSERLSKHDTPY